jgi:glycosyltransferase involved in cell wall biosynthesis
MVFETSFLFVLMSAVLYRGPSEWQARIGRDRAPAGRQRSWLILSYRANIPGSACAQHIDDRLPLLAAAGITPILLTGPVGERSGRWRHYRAWSLAPSGIRFEVRHFLRRHLARRWQFKLAETLLLLPVMPFYLLEKMVINLESEWSWCLAAAVRGALLERRHRPEVLYSTGGSASAHAAALFIQRRSGVVWLAETQDPLVHDREWQRSRMVFRLYCWLERRIAAACTAFIFLTGPALENARRRVGVPFPGVVIHPGASPGLFTPPVAHVRGPHCRFAHFGTLAGSRNLLVFLRALSLLFDEQPELRQAVRVDLYGSLDQPSRQLMAELGLADLVRDHGLIDRQEATQAMQRADCLLLIQNTTFFSTETIPSKVYEYLLSGRPILGLVHDNRELTAMLVERGHRVAPADDPQAVRVQLAALLRAHAAGEPSGRAAAAGPVLLDDAVRTLVALARGAVAETGGNGDGGGRHGTRR